MKKILLALLVASTTASAQIVVRDADENPDQQSTLTMQAAKQEADKNELRPTTGLYDFAWKSVDNGFMLGMRWGYKCIIFGYDMTHASSGSGSTQYKASGFDLYLGVRYRHYLVDRVWIEGDVALGYYSSSSEFGYGRNKVKVKGSDVGVMVMPRIGLNVWKGVGIFAGYRWDAPDFEFENAGAITVGISAAF